VVAPTDPESFGGGPSFTADSTFIFPIWLLILSWSVSVLILYGGWPHNLACRPSKTLTFLKEKQHFQEITASHPKMVLRASCPSLGLPLGALRGLLGGSLGPPYAVGSKHSLSTCSRNHCFTRKDGFESVLAPSGAPFGGSSGALGGLFGPAIRSWK
jgi:hypothetical protein